MPTPINPYADIINFPPGTPPGIINQVLQIRALSDANQNKMANQPGPWETGLNNVIGGVTNHLLFPWLQNNFVNLPYQTDLNTMQTDNNIRQFLAQQADLTSEENIRGINKQNLANEQLGAFGNAIGGFSDLQNQMTIPPGMDITGGISDTSQIAGPGLAGSGGFDTISPVDFSNQTEQPQGDITQIQGDLAPSGNAPIETATPGVSPSMSDVLRAFAGQRPMDAGMIAKALENPGIANILDPMQIERRKAETGLKQQQAATSEATMGATQARTDQLRQSLPGILQGMLDRHEINVQQAHLIAQRADLTGEQIITAGYKNDVLGNMSPETLAATLFPGKSATMLSAAMDVIKSQNPNASDAQVKQGALDLLQKMAVAKTVDSNQQVLPMMLARQESAKIQEELPKAMELNTQAQDIISGAKIADQYGMLPKTPAIDDVYRAKMNRNSPFNKQVYIDHPELAGALQQISQFYGAMDAAFVRGLGDQATRIKASLGLPDNPQDLTLGQIVKQMTVVQQGTGRQIQNYRTRLQLLTQYGGGSPVIGGGFDLGGTFTPQTGETNTGIFGIPDGFKPMSP